MILFGTVLQRFIVIDWLFQQVGPDLAKFCHIDKKLKLFGNFLRAYFEFGKSLNQLWQYLMLLRKFSLF